ncbi:MFS transporter [Embleya sp. NPDC020886]|uniref:MFS transporter n=1 Tax=Embleya sp. NPDC020886 TaxID=3363980 RepID=UPI0037A9123C
MIISARARSGAPATKPATGRRTAVGIAIVLGAQLMLTLDTTVVNVALPRIATGLNFGPAALSWVLNAYTLAFGGLLLLGGRLGDVYGRLRVFEIGLAVFTLSSLLGGFAQSPGWLVAARAAQGIGAALAAPGVLALVATSAPDPAARNRALALFSAVSMGGGTIGLLLGGLVTEAGSWRWTLLINVPIGIAILAFARRYVTETPRRHERFDVIGAVCAVGAAAAVVWAVIGAPDHGWTSARTIGGLAVGTILSAALAVTELRIPHPMLRPALLRSPQRLGGLAVMALAAAGQFSMFFLVVQYVQKIMDFNPVESGAAFLPTTLSIFAASRVAPRLVARFGQVPLLLVGTLGLSISFLWLSNVGTSSSYVLDVCLPMTLNGVSVGLIFMPVTSLVMLGVEAQHAGSASGLLQTAQQLGGSIGLAVIISVYAAGAVPGAFVPGLRPAFLTAAGLACTAFLVCALLARSNRRPRSAA